LIKVVYILLFPFSILYGSILYLRNKFYDWNIIKSTAFNFSVISVGNLAIGGVGKTPHIEYLVRLLNGSFKVATLSRGYKRKTTGFNLTGKNSSVEDVGDEPLQYKLKFENILVAVDEKRVHGIEKIKEIHPETNVILLDDAYQHRSVKPGINILITDYSKLYVDDNVIPSGRLREWSYGSERASIIIVSKTSSVLSPIEKEKIRERLNPKPYQEIYFSYIKYGQIIAFTDMAKNITNEVDKNCAVLLVTGIATSTPLFNELSSKYNSVEHIKFSDHHNFSTDDINNVKKKYNDIPENNKIIITTEKDIMRLSLPTILNQLQKIPIFYIPIEICFHDEDKKKFDTQILKYVTANSRN